MRISGGEWRGRRLKTPPGDKVRPTQDRVREALFSMLAERVVGAVWIDLFAGSGAVGLEALSRGAERVIWVEKDARNIAVLKENLTALGISDGRVIRADAIRWLETGGVGIRADAVFADPPYAAGKENGVSEMLFAAARHDVVRPGGMFIAEMPLAREAEEIVGWTLVKNRVYGRTRLALYRREEA